MPAWCIHTLCDLDQDLLQQQQQEYDLQATLTTDFGALLADPDVDAVALFTPDHLHAEQAVACLAAGKHLLLTKPIATDQAEIDQISAAVAANPNCIFFAGHTSRFIPSFMDQYRDYRDGKIGKLLSVETEYNGDKRQRAAYLAQNWGHFSPIHIWLIHSLDLALWYLNNLTAQHLSTATSAHFKTMLR